MSDEEKKRKRQAALEKRQARAAQRKGTGTESGGGFNMVQAPRPEEGAELPAQPNDQQKPTEMVGVERTSGENPTQQK